ncbi:MAG: aminoacyl-histidine dipeptidase [Bacteroidales bacterium]|nr:aminoacyl-histidine dipeptidase [Bacteroidales bacterium]
MNETTQLQPQAVWKYFHEINQIPRPSKKESKMIAYLMETGAKLGVETLKDAAGNVLMRKPATPGLENVPPIIFQAHMDMVCEKNSDVDFNFETDAIQTYIDGEWLKAKGTTLGADDGIGVAMALAILESKDIAHGPVECLFTVDEETGLTGAYALEKDFLKGKILLNLDSEDEGQFFIGCAGGKNTEIRIDFEEEDVPKNSKAFRVMVKGLQGGHSGDDINKKRGNAIKLLTRILHEATFAYDAELAHIDGGNLHNAIAREASAVLVMQSHLEEDFTNFIRSFEKTVRQELKNSDAGVQVEISPAELPKKVMDNYTQCDLVEALYACPHGVLAMDQDIEGFVETSTNLASIKMEGKQITIVTSQRSSLESKKDDAANMVASAFELMGADITFGDGYPGWSPNADSKVLKLMKQAYQNLFKKDPQVLVIHAGLECGLIGEKYPEMDMISYGPTLRGVHSPDEKLLIHTVKEVWDLTLEFIRLLNA